MIFDQGVLARDGKCVQHRLAVCCQPTPSVAISAFAIAGEPVIVHRADCAVAAQLATHPLRSLAAVEWDRAFLTVRLEANRPVNEADVDDLVRRLRKHWIEAVWCVGVVEAEGSVSVELSCLCSSRQVERYVYDGTFPDWVVGVHEKRAMLGRWAFPSSRGSSRDWQLVLPTADPAVGSPVVGWGHAGWRRW